MYENRTLVRCDNSEPSKKKVSCLDILGLGDELSWSQAV